MPDEPPPNPRHQAVRWKHLCRLWRELTLLPRIPQLDRWLSQQLRREHGFGKRDRQWYSDELFAAARFGYLALFCEALAERALTQQRGTSLSDADVLAFVAEFGAGMGSVREVQSAWARQQPGNLFFWVRSRVQADGGAPTGEAIEPEQGYAYVWRVVSRALRASNHLSSRLLWNGVPLSYADAVAARARAAAWSPLQTEQFLTNHATRPPLWLRLNHEQQRPQVLDELRSSGFIVSEHASGAVSVVGTRGVYDLASHRGGLIEVQDLASQLIGACVACRPGQFVWDCCAGSGGKTLQLASRLAGRGAVYASDIREHKLEDLRERGRRTSFSNIRVVPWQGTTLPRFGKAVDERGGFDWVLVDAPCSSSGTWRRNPDGRLRLDLADLPAMTNLQLQLLANAAKALKPGGSLVYATCSWLVEEDEGVVERFVRQAPGFSLASTRMPGSPAEDADTMFVALLARG